MYYDKIPEQTRKPRDLPGHTDDAIVKFVQARLGEGEGVDRIVKASETIESYIEWYDTGCYYTQSRQAVRAGVQIVKFMLGELVALSDRVAAMTGDPLLAPATTASDNAEVVKKLQNQIKKLQARVAALEPKKKPKKKDNLKPPRKRKSSFI